LCRTCQLLSVLSNEVAIITVGLMIYIIKGPIGWNLEAVLLDVLQNLASKAMNIDGFGSDVSHHKLLAYNAEFVFQIVSTVFA
jgi:hypothetical protein